MPVEIADAIPFELDDTSMPPTTRRRCSAYWLALVADGPACSSEFRGRFLGKVSPVHLFWGALDLAVTRFSGRPAPPHPGGAPNCGPQVMLEAYSHEVSSAGYWPGGDGEGVFYSYAYPEPDRLPSTPVHPRPSAPGTSAGRVRPCPTTACAPRSNPTRACSSSSRAPTRRPRTADWDRADLERNPANVWPHHE